MSTLPSDTANVNQEQVIENIRTFFNGLVDTDFPQYAERCLSIIDKQTAELVPFKLNRAQLYFHNAVERQLKETGKVRVITVKGRKQGISSYIQGRGYAKTSTKANRRAFIMAHEAEATSTLYEMAKRFHKHQPEVLRPNLKTSSAKELVFDVIDSGYRLGTAGTDSTGRSQTIFFMHQSEAAFYKSSYEIAAGAMQAVPDAPGTEIYLESTANGPNGFFYELWQDAVAGKSPFVAVFIPWFWQPEYRSPARGIEPDEEEDAHETPRHRL